MREMSLQKIKNRADGVITYGLKLSVFRLEVSTHLLFEMTEVRYCGVNIMQLIS